jgi:hypothetical protein
MQLVDTDQRLLEGNISVGKEGKASISSNPTTYGTCFFGLCVVEEGNMEEC